MKNVIKFAIILSVILILSCVLFRNNNVYEKVYDSTDAYIASGEGSLEGEKNYDIYVTDTEITFYDLNGNSIIYAFEDDRLKSVFNVYNASNEVEAKKIAAYFTAQIGKGEILKVNHVDNAVSVQMDINYFSEYKDYTKKQIEEILLKDASFVNEEE